MHAHDLILSPQAFIDAGITVLYLVFAVRAVRAWGRDRAKGYDSQAGRFLASLATVFGACGLTGYLIHAIGIVMPEWRDAAEAVRLWSSGFLLLSTATLVGLEVRFNLLSRINRAEGERQEALAEKSLSDRLTSAALDTIARRSASMFAVYAVHAEPHHPHGIDLCVVNASGAFLRYFATAHSPETAVGMSHYKLFGDILNPEAMTEGRPDYVRDHLRAAQGEYLNSGMADTGDGEFRSKSFMWHLHPLLPGAGPTLGGEDAPLCGGLLMEVIDTTEAERVRRERDEALRQAQEADRAIRATGAALAKRNRDRLLGTTDDAA